MRPLNSWACKMYILDCWSTYSQIYDTIRYIINAQNICCFDHFPYHFLSYTNIDILCFSASYVSPELWHWLATSSSDLMKSLKWHSALFISKRNIYYSNISITIQRHCYGQEVFYCPRFQSCTNMCFNAHSQTYIRLRKTIYISV